MDGLVAGYLWSELLPRYGLFGDYIGGVWGTFISLVTLILVFLTWRTTRRTVEREMVFSIVVEMLKTHDSITESNLGMSRLFLREFSKVYLRCLYVNKNHSNKSSKFTVKEMVNISYLYSYYGLSTNVEFYLGSNSKFKKIADYISKKYKYKDIPNSNPNVKYFVGHQDDVSHYMRNLFSMYIYIDKSKLKRKEKESLAKVVRSKLSNYDQALLALNIISDLGSDWEKESIVDKYKPFTNVPKGFFGYDRDLDLKKIFPNVDFEWERHSK